MTAYYNEHDAYAAQWLRNLIAAGHIAPGVVDERSIQDVTAGDLAGFTQCHFFAGIGVWSLALRRAGWPDDRPVWTMSCPCQPFSAAGAGAGFDDERHLWPDAFHLITQCTPAVVFGEQVASKPVEPWVDLVHADLEALGYAFGCVPFPSAGVGAPHIRDRAYWVADSQSNGHQRAGQLNESSGRDGTSHLRTIGRMADADGGYSSAEREQCSGQQRQQPEDCSSLLGLGNTESVRREGECLRTGAGLPQGGTTQTGVIDRVADVPGCGRGEERQDAGGQPIGDCPQGRPTGSEHGSSNLPAGPVNGFWRGADWISCRDDKWRPVEPGTFPLANGAPSRVGRLRAYGNAINAEAATQFILAYLEQPQVIYLTPYDTTTLTCTGASTDSGFTTLDEVRQMMGEPDMAHPRMLTYGDSCFTDFVLSVEPTP